MPLKVAPCAGPFKDSETHIDADIDVDLGGREDTWTTEV